MRFLLFIKSLINSRTAQILVLSNLFLLFYALIDRGNLITPFHFHYESILIKILAIINLPALFSAGIIVTILFTMLSIANDLPSQYIQYLIAVLCASGQWALIGYWVEAILKRRLHK